jgi:hypothetical protein
VAEAQPPNFKTRMVYQAPRRKCLQNWPKSSGFDPGQMHLPAVPLLILENLLNQPDFSAERHESRASVIDAG